MPKRRARPAGAPVLDLPAARAVALELLSRRAWPRERLRQRLRQRGTPPAVAAAVVAELEDRGYLDDRAFAEAWAESRARARAVGGRRLREELLARGIARPLVESAIGHAFGETDEETRARAAAARRWGLLRQTAPGQAARRLQDYLLRRGYPGDVVRRVVRETSRMVIEDD